MLCNNTEEESGSALSRCMRSVETVNVHDKTRHSGIIKAIVSHMEDRRKESDLRPFTAPHTY